MRQLLLPIDPGPKWRDAPVVPGFGARPLTRVLADVLAWRARTAAEEPGRRGAERPLYRGAPTFLRGLAVPTEDLHAFAAGQLDEALLDLYLRACLALDWQGVRHDWPYQEFAALPVPTLGLLQSLAAGLAIDGTASRFRRTPDVPLLALNPDWPTRLSAGRVRDVHNEARLRLRQAGWDAVPLPNGLSVTDGDRICAALVPRCQAAHRVLARFLARRVNTDPELNIEVHQMEEVS